jgi:UDP-N-acetylglucosamine 1-carboxyvinyltransferase
LSVIHIQGLKSLHGGIPIQGSKNAVLPLMAAALLHSGTIVLRNVPEIQDVFCMLGILKSLGCHCIFKEHDLIIDTRNLDQASICHEQGKKMRSSVMLLGPLLGRLHKVETCFPGGCSIGKRPIDLHLSALEKMGARIEVKGEHVTAYSHKLHGADIRLAFPSVGATENILMAAVTAEGVTRIYGAAREPEIGTLCQFLSAMGARIEGTGSSFLTVYGEASLKDTTFVVPGDRIVAGTYLGAVMAVGGDICLSGVPVDHMEGTLQMAREAGCELCLKQNQIQARMKQRPLPFKLITGPYPEFSTDLQSVMLAVASVAQGESCIQENVFEGRFATAQELNKLGAHIIIEEGTALVTGGFPLRGSTVQAWDLRGGAALVVAGLAADGESRIHGYSYISRGYEDICRDLKALGASLSLEED